MERQTVYQLGKTSLQLKLVENPTFLWATFGTIYYTSTIPLKAQYAFECKIVRNRRLKIDSALPTSQEAKR